MNTAMSMAANAYYGKRWAALALLCTAQFMVIMDTSIIGVALPAIKEELQYTQSGLQWIFNAYVVLFGGLLLLGGRLSDLFGARKLFLWGFAILTISSLLAGLAWSPASLNTGRALQGLGSALIAPSAMTLLMSTFTDPKELGKAFGFWGASAAAGGSAGVFLGGVITEWLDWRWVFLVNIPIGLIVLALGKQYLLPGKKVEGKIDWAGAIQSTVALITLVYAIVSAESAGWISVQTIGILAASISLFIVFIIRQKNSQSPILPLSIFKAPNLSAGNISMALMAAAWIPLWFFLNLYLQQILQLNAFQSGLALLPMTIIIMIVMVGLTGKLVGKFGFKTNLVAGLVSLTLSLILFSFVPDSGTYMGNVLPASILGALGMSLAYIPGTMASMSGAKPEETGLASGIVNTSYQIGSAIGLAVVAVFAASVTKASLADGLAEKAALNEGFQSAFGLAACFSAIAVLVAILKIRQPK
ncbi:DHA2 family efflux MFS transporter permease subunit [Flavihumibacter rivuli]|uniref:MFS transporter n=1 Tax=Flavihumibacter rivuli TaxID=2838156 RepID=UPI001BDF07EB|nr:MFS transporter [Flavihumibacter rivuli]ULQ55657.1 DHA2 family efflux MFS transporter permease subunit [Flavihumibacter rivuli]